MSYDFLTRLLTSGVVSGTYSCTAVACQNACAEAVAFYISVSRLLIVLLTPSVLVLPKLSRLFVLYKFLLLLLLLLIW